MVAAVLQQTFAQTMTAGMSSDIDADLRCTVRSPIEADNTDRLAAVQPDQRHRIGVRQPSREPRDVRLPGNFVRLPRHCSGLAFVSPLPKNSRILDTGRPEAQ